ncbi:MAG: VWA domain-containing protein, partial [Pseudonocardia sp.]|nr:VWA domain-containing protein [Pseudonocardia sp.]
DGGAITATVGADGLHLQVGQVRIDAPPGVAPEGTTATARLVEPLPGSPLLPAIGPSVDVELSGGRQPEQPVTITFPAAAGYTVRSIAEVTGPDDVAPVGLSRSGPGLPVRTETAVYDPATETVAVTMDHLTEASQASLNLADLAAEISRRTFGGESPRPGCHGQPGTDASGREIVLTPTVRPSVWSCVRGDFTDAVVELTNTTPGPWVMNAPGAALEPRADLSLANAFLIAAGPYVAGGPVLPVHGQAAYRFPLGALPGTIELSTSSGIYLLSIFAEAAGLVGEVFGYPVLEVLASVDAALDCLGSTVGAAGGRPPPDVLDGMVVCAELVADQLDFFEAARFLLVVGLIVPAAGLIASGVAGVVGQLLGPQEILIERGPPVATPDPVVPVPAGSGETPVVFVVDTSGSMGETDGSGVVKLESAREALIGRINSDLTATSSTGLWTYPAAASCSAGGFQREVRAGPTSELSAQLRQLTPAGDTPTAAALTAVHAALVDDGYRAATLVLVSDGESNCEQPPCEAARSIVEGGFDLRVHAVGFDISGAGRSELACIADATGGQYLDSPDGEQLATLLRDVSRPQLDLQVTLPEAAPAAIPVDVTVRLRVSGGAPAEDVRLDVQAITADGTVVPVLAPVVRLGNLAPGTDREQAWTLTVPDGGPLRIVVSARSTTARPVVVERGLTRRGELTAADVGPSLRPVADGVGRLVIMGDSWSSGEGAGGYDGATDTPANRCHRSPRTYGAGIFEGDRVILACSGATTAHFAGSQLTGDAGQRRSVRPQLDQLRDVAGESAAVALTVGGNDIGFSDVITECLLLGGAYSCDPLGRGRAERIATMGQTSLIGLYLAVHDELNAPDAVAARAGLVAPVIVLPYATPVNRLNAAGCGLISATEASLLRDLTDALNAAIADAVGAARADGANVYFASDVQDAFLPDHTLCSADSHLVEIPPDVLTRGVVDWSELARSEDPAAQEIAHPDLAGYRAVTGALVRWSQRELPPVPPPRAARDVVTWDGGGDPVRAASGQVTDVGAGRAVTLAGAGFAPGSPVRLEVRSVPRTIGEAMADDDGVADVPGQVPGDLAAGAHELVLVGSDRAGRPHEVVASVDVRAPVPWWVLGGLPALAVAALVGAARLFLGARPPRARR